MVCYRLFLKDSGKENYGRPSVQTTAARKNVSGSHPGVTVRTAIRRWPGRRLPNPVIGTIHTFTQVVYAGTGIELSTPYWQVDVEIPGLATIPKSYLLYGKPYIGMKVKAEFRTKKPTNTVLDYYWVPLEE